jgi:uncharacterized membrane protein YbhN (UPF0104 family)
MSVLTNWIGYLLLAGVLFALHPLELPPQWRIGTAGLRVLGIVLCLLVAGYLGLCFIAKRRTWNLRQLRCYCDFLSDHLLRFVPTSFGKLWFNMGSCEYNTVIYLAKSGRCVRTP